MHTVEKDVSDVERLYQESLEPKVLEKIEKIVADSYK